MLDSCTGSGAELHFIEYNQRMSFLVFRLTRSKLPLEIKLQVHEKHIKVIQIKVEKLHYLMRLAPSIKRAVSPLWFFFHSNSLSYIFLFMISRIRLYCSICFSRIQDYCAGKNTLFLGFKELQDVFISIILHVLCSDIGILLR